MIISRLLAGMIAVMSLSSVVVPTSNGETTDGERDSRIIVEVSRGLDGLSDDQIKSSQIAVLNRIRSNVTTNIEYIDSYSVLNNAFVIEVNSNNIEAIKSLPGVASVTIDKLHARKAIGEGETYSAKITKDSVDPNISAGTMQKPSGTKDGEGTVVAILDNEFFFRGAHTETDDCNFHKFGCTGASILHEVYTDLDASTHVRFTYDNLTNVLKTTNAKRNSKAAAGQEGSLYLNRKVPFYYDYGGESTSYGKPGKMDYDVSSIMTYHGSHVASITAANAPSYKGIAPKAQLACMKVFTNYIADDTAENLGFGDSSGAYDSCILKALEDCIKLGVDGINMSLGSDLDDFDGDSITLKTLSNLANGGILTAISAGNAGKTSYSFTGGYGNWTRDMVETGIMSSYANNKSVMTIASGQPDKVFFETAIKVSGKNIQYKDQIVNTEYDPSAYSTEFKLADLVATYGSTLNWQYVPGFGTSADYEGLDVENKVAVVNRGSTSFSSKYEVAVNKGAIGLIIINNDPTASDFSFRCSFGDDFNPSMPCALALYKDKTKFSSVGSGTFTFITKEVSDNDEKRTMSTFSTDGATFDLDLKPEITAPGELIKGAVPPQTSDDKTLTPLSTYQYLSGTSMSAPNFAGAQALVQSTKSADVYDENGNIVGDQAAATAYRKTVNMRLMSTAEPMLDTTNNPETNVKNYSSPRLQGAGMVNLDGAMKTPVYIQGRGLDGNPVNKSKVCLGNNDDISKGNIKIEFDAINDDTANHSYDIKLTVMRPAIKEDNQIISKEYNYRSEISDIKYLPGIRYYDSDLDKMVSSSGNASYKDVFKLGKQLEYYASKEDYDDHNPTIMAQDYYYVVSKGDKQTSNIKYEILPDYSYQSTQDVVLLDKQLMQTNVSIAPGSNTLHVEYSLTSDMKNKILKYYEYGCMIEGYVTLESKDSQPNLSVPYLGFYSGSDVDETKSYLSAPVVEPFEFEKDKTKIYPSELANDITKSLVGKDNVDFGSMWMVGYSDNPENINTEKILTNDMNPKMLTGFHPIGTNPLTDEYSADVNNNLYAGNPEKTNTMIIQQYVMRSVNDNFFTITNTKTGDVVYKSVLEDMLFGDQYGRYPLYKSHIDANYLSAGYAAHRAFAKIPLYDTETNESFEDGIYEIEFNYQLVGCGNQWVSKSYKFVIDSTDPEMSEIKQYTDENGTEIVRFEFEDVKLSYGVIGYQLFDFEYDETKKVYYVELEKVQVDEIMEEIGQSSAKVNRLYIKAVDQAFGETGVVIHFLDPNDYANYECISGPSLKVNNDFIVEENGIKTIEIDIAGTEKTVEIDNLTYTTTVIPTPTPEPSKGGLPGWGIALIVVGSVVVAAGLGVGAYFLFFRKKLIAKKGVNNDEK